jgi:competence protein ComEA
MVVLISIIVNSGCNAKHETILELQEEIPNSAVSSEQISNPNCIEVPKNIYVYICGAINEPGVYEMPEVCRLYEVVEKAGGLREEASASYLNQAEILTDGQKIYVPTEEEVIATEETNVNVFPESSEKSLLIDINTASVNELMTLTGVGESRALSIIAFREENGKFQGKEDIMKVTGIKEGLYNKIKDQIMVSK